MQAMDLSARVRRIGESATLKVTRRAMQMKAQGIDVVDFGAGEPDFASPAVAVEAARQALADGFTKYTQNQGSRPCARRSPSATRSATARPGRPTRR